MKSGSRDKAEGTVDKIAGRVMEAFSKLTGNRSAGAKGKAARGRGASGRPRAARSRRSKAPDRRPGGDPLIRRDPGASLSRCPPSSPAILSLVPWFTDSRREVRSPVSGCRGYLLSVGYPVRWRASRLRPRVSNGASELPV
jgi:hypothetical protein